MLVTTGQSMTLKVNEVVLRQVSFWTLFSRLPLSIIPPMLHTHPWSPWSSGGQYNWTHFRLQWQGVHTHLLHLTQQKNIDILEGLFDVRGQTSVKNLAPQCFHYSSYHFSLQQFRLLQLHFWQMYWMNTNRTPTFSICVKLSTSEKSKLRYLFLPQGPLGVLCVRMYNSILQDRLVN